MDRNYTIGLILIGLVFVAWMVFMSPQSRLPEPTMATDSLAIDYDTMWRSDEAVEPRIGSGPDTMLAVTDTLPEELVTVETDVYMAKLSSRGAGLISFILKKFDYSAGEPIEMIHSGGLAVPNLRFNRGELNLEQVGFSVDKSTISLSGTESEKLQFSYTFPTGETLTKTYRFFGDKYSFDLELEINGIGTLDLRDYYEIYFEPGLEPTEKKIEDDLGRFKAYALLGDDIESFDDFDKSGRITEDLDGVVDWISTRSKFFTVALMPQTRNASGMRLDGSRRSHDEDRGITGYSHIGIALKMRLGQRDNLFDAFTVYIGPLDYNILSEYGNNIENTLDLGWSVIRPFSKFITWFLVLLHQYIPNYGVVIILFTVLIKLIFSPLSLMSMKSMRKMQTVQPMMNAIKEKYKKDPQKMNQEIMKLYKQEKVNPIGGCLPMLPQIPIFYGLFTVFRSTIEFRGAPFIFWMQDLSQPDKLYILPVIMAVTMFVQQKITMKDPKQKMMVYIFPALFLWWGITFPSGLVLYWTVFNIFGLLEAVFVHKRHLPVSTEAVPVADVKQPKQKK